MNSRSKSEHCVMASGIGTTLAGAVANTLCVGCWGTLVLSSWQRGRIYFRNLSCLSSLLSTLSMYIFRYINFKIKRKLIRNLLQHCDFVDEEADVPEN